MGWVEISRETKFYGRNAAGSSSNELHSDRICFGADPTEPGVMQLEKKHVQRYL